jgi:hypothetical protein
MNTAQAACDDETHGVDTAKKVGLFYLKTKLKFVQHSNTQQSDHISTLISRNGGSEKSRLKSV